MQKLINMALMFVICVLTQGCASIGKLPSVSEMNTMSSAEIRKRYPNIVKHNLEVGNGTRFPWGRYLLSEFTRQYGPPDLCVKRGWLSTSDACSWFFEKNQLFINSERYPADLHLVRRVFLYNFGANNMSTEELRKFKDALRKQNHTKDKYNMRVTTPSATSRH